MDETRAAGLSVLRTWAFCDGSEWNALQPAPGEWDERVFGALDWVVAQAGARGLRLIFALTNYWAAYGGIKQYVRRAHTLFTAARLLGRRAALPDVQAPDAGTWGGICCSWPLRRA